MRRDGGLVNVGTLATIVGLMGLDLAAIRLGFGRSLRLLRGLWHAVPELSTLGLALGAIALTAFALTMTWRQLRSRAARRPRPARRSFATTAVVFGALAAGGCATTATRAQHSPTALCSDLTLDHRSLYCANDLPRAGAMR